MQDVESYLLALQDKICTEFEHFEPTVKFHTDLWQRSAGGGGRTRVLQGGKVFEKVGVNFSHVHGKQLPPAATSARPELAGASFDAIGVSLVVHPVNPFVPTTHANVRFFMATKPDAEPQWWFGGGFDLTPYYGFEEDCIHWHHIAQQACQPFGEACYAKYKKWCDEYFYLPHRQEARGIGGLFFDDVHEDGFEHSFALMRSVGDHFLPAYIPILQKRVDYPFDEQQRAFQAYRRGRYVEFNLIYDRGTLFGLQSGGRTESILMSLPPKVIWDYNWRAEPGSAEAKLTEYFLQPQNWIDKVAA